MTLARVDQGVCAAKGFRAAGVACGIKHSGDLDLALLVSDTPASVAGTFTSNAAAAAPVRVSRQRVTSGKARGVVVNSGCANACTGERGMADAEEMAEAAAVAVGCDLEEMLVCSTGLIGAYLPMDQVRAGIEKAAGILDEDDALAAGAIMTTDTLPKRVGFRHQDGWSLGGIAKGAGMIAPNMATMLAFIATDARVSAPRLQALLGETVDSTFNAVTVDGDTSTNDTVLTFANGAAGIEPSEEQLRRGLMKVCESLAESIASDGEGATKLVRLTVKGAPDAEAARAGARAVAESLLVKTAVHGGDANWGRIAAALGQAGLPCEQLTVAIGGAEVLTKGTPGSPRALEKARLELKKTDLTIVCDVGLGDAQARMLTCDLSPEYVTFNATYEP